MGGAGGLGKTRGRSTISPEVLPPEPDADFGSAWYSCVVNPSKSRTQPPASRAPDFLGHDRPRSPSRNPKPPRTRGSMPTRSGAWGSGAWRPSAGISSRNRWPIFREPMPAGWGWGKKSRWAGRLLAIEVLHNPEKVRAGVPAGIRDPWQGQPAAGRSMQPRKGPPQAMAPFSYLSQSPRRGL